MKSDIFLIRLTELSLVKTCEFDPHVGSSDRAHRTASEHRERGNLK